MSIVTWNLVNLKEKTASFRGKYRTSSCFVLYGTTWFSPGEGAELLAHRREKSKPVLGVCIKQVSLLFHSHYSEFLVTRDTEFQYNVTHNFSFNVALFPQTPMEYTI